MKKILLTLAVAALAIVTISGCAKKEEVKEPETTQAVQEAQEGFNVDAPVMQQEAKIETDGEIFPLPVEIDPDNMPDGDWPAQFSSASIVGKDDKRSINCSIYTKDYYDTVEVHNMKVGDLVQVDDEEIEIEDFKNTMQGYVINGGPEEGGVLLVPAEGGTYVSRGMNDVMSYTYQCDVGIDMAEDIVLIDATLYSPGAQTKVEGIQKVCDYIKELETENAQHFNQYNTTISTTDNKITGIKVVYVP